MVREINKTYELNGKYYKLIKGDNCSLCDLNNKSECQEMPVCDNHLGHYKLLINDNFKVGSILGITYSDGNENVKIIAIENGNIVIAKNFTSEIITDNDIAIAIMPDDRNISKIKIKGVWLDYQVLN